MSGSVSPLPWTGNKGCIYTTIDAFMPPHRTYVEACIEEIYGITMGIVQVKCRKCKLEEPLNLAYFRRIYRNQEQINPFHIGSIRR